MIADRFCDIDELHQYLVSTRSAAGDENALTEESIASVNALLERAGFEGSLPTYSRNAGPQHALCESLTILKKTLKSLKKADGLETEERNVLKSLERRRNDSAMLLKKATSSLEADEKKIAALEVKVRDDKRQLSASSARLRKELQELNTFRESMLQKESQALVELRKEEMEHEKIKDRLRVITSATERRARPARQYGDFRETCADAAFLNDFILSFKAREEKLLQANEQYRAGLAQYDSVFDCFLNETNSSSHLHALPFDMINDELEEHFFSRLAVVKSELERAKVDPMSVLTTEEVVRLRDLLSQQEFTEEKGTLLRNVLTRALQKAVEINERNVEQPDAALSCEEPGDAGSLAEHTSS
mmetsp:Transcript_7348/g.22403  ORF Transcript_7348/g.22403 Transcript_7348/m.22403 type:complete len:361 (+) Transcript_7348:76-1158(+)